METRDKAILIRMTEKERKAIKQKAQRAGMTVSAFVRSSLLHSNTGTIRVIDTKPLKEALWELKKQGVNLNQFMRFLNTYGPNGFDKKEAERMMEKEADAFWQVLNALSVLRAEAARENIVIAEEDSGEESEE